MKASGMRVYDRVMDDDNRWSFKRIDSAILFREYMREQKREVGEGGSGRSRSGVDLQTFGVYWGGREGITSKQTKKKERKKESDREEVIDTQLLRY